MTYGVSLVDVFDMLQFWCR